MNRSIVSQQVRAGECDPSGVRWIQLDEYVGLNEDDPRSFRAQLERSLFGPCAVAPSASLMLRQSKDAAVEIALHADAIAETGGIDLQLFGLGQNGHLAFNEPGSRHDSLARVVDLAEQTQALAAGAFAPDPAPVRGMTLGLGDIAAARSVLLVVIGWRKADALAQAIHGVGNTSRPFNALRTHADLTLVADAAAVSKLPQQVWTPK